MAQRYYPQINPQAIRQVLDFCRADPGYIDDPSCPYPLHVKALFKKEEKSSTKQSENTAPPAKAPDVDFSNLGLEEELRDVYQKLQDYGATLSKTPGEDDETSAKNTYFRLSVSLLEKIIDLRKDLDYIKNINQFIEAVVDGLGEVLTTDQRNEFMAQLSPLLVGSPYQK